MKNIIHRIAFLFVLSGCFLHVSFVSAEEFIYKHQKGDTYRILSSVDEEVYVNRVLSHRAEIFNRIAVEVTDEQNGIGTHKAEFLTAEKASGVAGRQSFQWSREYQSIFERDPSGLITIDDQYYMPVVRNVPVFPAKDMEIGETWTAEGHEVHDFRDGFGIQEPYRIPFNAEYTYLGPKEWKGKTYPTFSVSYRIFNEPPKANGYVWPIRIMGASDQTVYWDPELGQTAAYSEFFRMIFELSSGDTFEYRGTAQAEIIESVQMDKDKMAEEIIEDIDQMGIEDTSVRIVDEGITITLEDIQFQADSAKLMPSEQQKLDKISEILKRYPERDILVGGHTALAGSAEGRMLLSVERAAATADYLIANQVRTADRIVVQGYGAEKPLADNRTEEGMRKNRRVEITILEN
ncbi:MAG: OmpA family protein [Treponema sp.]|jgi:outer membrane protein OmpA-like peptidoglycan-associated protein|nr:OmpA family protein [Treponema sp.]